MSSKTGVGQTLHRLRLRALGLGGVVPDFPPLFVWSTIHTIDGKFVWVGHYPFALMSSECMEELFDDPIRVKDRLSFGGQFLVDVISYNPCMDAYVLERWKA